MTTATDLSNSFDPLAAVLGRVPAGVFVLAVGDGTGRETGMLASWVQQAGFEPPMLTVAVNRGRWWLPWLDAHPKVALSIVGAAQKDLLKRFGKGFAEGEPAFAELAVARGVTGLPLLVESIGSLEGTIVGRLPSGDHEICLVRIDAARAGAALDAEGPMVHIRKNGLKY